MINVKKITLKESENLNKPYYSIDKVLTDINLDLESKLITPIFYVSKFHKRKCSHSSSKTKKNLIKKLIQKDYFTFKTSIESISISLQKENGKMQKIKTKTNSHAKQLKEENSKIKNLNIEDDIAFLNTFNAIKSTNLLCLSETGKDDNNLFLKKKTTNRNFRLFDKDVVIKKIMSNFLKFVKLIIESFLIDNKFNSLYELKKKSFEENFANEQKCKSFLFNKKIKDFLLIKKFNNKKSLTHKNECNYKAFDQTYLIDVYQNVFLCSSFLIKYIFPKIKKDHDLSYYSHFNKFLLKILE